VTRFLAALVLVTALLVPSAVVVAQSCPSNASGPDELRLTLTQTGTDLDLGWTGAFHDLDVPGSARFRFCLQNCDTASDSLCTVAGQAGDATVQGRRFAAPIPVVAGGVAVCIFTSFQAPYATGTADVSTGAINVTAGFSAAIHVTATNAICPKCTGATAGASGICTGGTTPGAPCVTDEVIPVVGAAGDTTYEVSRNCLPSGTPSTVALSMNVTTGTSTLAGLCAGQSAADGCAAACGTTCTPTGGGSGVSQNCCSTEQSKRCFPTEDTGQIQRTGAAGVPLPAFPDPTYPKTAASTVVGTFCSPASGSGTVDPLAGLAGPAAFVLPVDAQWLDSSVPVTTTTTLGGGGTTSTTLGGGGTTTTTLGGGGGTTTTTLGGGGGTTTTTLGGGGGNTTTTLGGGGPTTTSTTLPVSCTGAADCDDGDPCTTDDCPGGICTFAQQSGAAGADCELADFLARPPCTLDARLLTAATTLVGKARTAVQVHSVPGVSAKVAAKAKKRADRALKKLGKKAQAANKRGRIAPPGCDTTIAAEILRLRALVVVL
jgi:hypothetical protein